LGKSGCSKGAAIRKSLGTTALVIGKGKLECTSHGAETWAIIQPKSRGVKSNQCHGCFKEKETQNGLMTITVKESSGVCTVYVFC